MREKAHKPASPTYAIVDSKSVEGPGENRGYDGGKKSRVESAISRWIQWEIYREGGKGNLHDTQGGYYPALAAKTPYPTIMGFCGDAGYRGIFIEEIEEAFGLPVDIQERKKGVSWEILPRRWVVERTLAWPNSSRRLSKDYEIKTATAESITK